MDRAATALLDSRDEAARRLAADEQLIANRFCARQVAVAYGTSSVITWAPDGLSFTSESRDESTARWAGYRLLSEIRDKADDQRKELIWMGTRRTEAGTHAAQFLVEDGE